MIARIRAGARQGPPDDPEAVLVAFTIGGVAEAISQAIDADLQVPGVTAVQPHEGNVVEFRFRARAFQTASLGD